MNILILSQYFWPENFRINDAARELAARGHHVTVLTGQPNYPGGEIFPDYRRDAARFAHLDDVKIVRVPLIPRGKSRARLALNYLSFAVAASTLGISKLAGRRFDVILTFLPSPATAVLPGVVLRAMRRIPHVVWVQDLWPDSLRASGVSSPLLLKLTDRFVRWAYRSSDHLIGQSNAFLAQLRSQSPASLPISYLPNWSAGPARAARPDSRVKSTFDLYFLGNLGQAQDLPTVMDAARLVAANRAIHWHFVGDGSMADWLRHRIKELGLASNVHLHEPVSPEQLQPFIDDADALLVSLRADPLYAMTVPSKVQSYLSSGRPIAALLDGEGADMLTQAGAGLVAPTGDSAGLARVVQRLAALAPDEREAMGEAGIRYCGQHFDFGELITRLESVLGEVQYAGQQT